jgi:hypothetical protein
MFDRIRKIFEEKQRPPQVELEEFRDLTYRLIDLMVEFSLYTLRTIAKKRGVPLNRSQIEEAVNFDVQFRLQQIQDPELLEIVRDQAVSRFIEEQGRT